MGIMTLMNGESSWEKKYINALKVRPKKLGNN